MGGGAVPYASRVAALGWVALWSLGDASGPTAADASGNGRTGTYSNVTLGASGPAVPTTAATFVPASSSLVNVYSASLAGAFNGAEGTAACWFRVSAAGVWTDATIRRFLTLQVDGSNRVLLQRTAGDNQYQASYVAGGTTKSVTVTGAGSTGWLHLAITWNKAADRVRVYANGAQSGATQTGLGTWAGSLASNVCAIGSSGTTPGSLWSGDLAWVGVAAREFTAAEVLSLATV